MNRALSDSWLELNRLVMALKDERRLKAMLDAELRSKARRNYVLRIHNRYNRVRGERERAELERALRKRR